MSGRMRLGLLKFAVFLPLIGLPSSVRNFREQLGPWTTMTAERVALEPGNPARTQLGPLTYLGGVWLKSRDPNFGGFSSLHVEGVRFTLLSDSGSLLRFRMGEDWQPRDVSFGDLPGGPGKGIVKEDRDSESLAYDPATQRYWAGFEQYNAVYRYDESFTHAERGYRPPSMADWSSNGGAESMVRLSDGRFLLISETTRPGDGRRRAERVVLIFPGDPTDPNIKPVELSYVPPAGYDPSDATELPDGRLLVLNRKFSVRGLFTAKLTLVDIRDAAAGQVLGGTEIATFDRPLLHDNFEGVTAIREKGATVLWIVSDDNQQFWEQTLLLKFRLDL